MTFSLHGSTTGGYQVGPIENAFEGVDLAAAQAARDAYFSANPAKLAAYDSNPFFLIRLTYGATTNAEYRMAGAWVDYTPFLQGLPGEVASLTNVPVGELPYKTLDGTFAGSRMRVLDDGSLLAPPGFGVESGSVKFGDVLLLSEAAGFLSISNLINDRQYTILDYYTPRTAASSVPTAFMGTDAAFSFVAQSDDTVNLTTEPLLFDYTIQNTSRTYSLFMRAFAAMSNVRIKITQISNGVALKYIPSKEAWETEVGGLEWVIGDNNFDFGDTPLIFSTGQNIRFEIRATTMALKGNASGIPYFGGSDQLGEFRDVLMADQYTATDVRDKLTSLTGTNRLPMSAVKDGVTSVAGRIGDVLLTASDVSGLAAVATTGAYASLSGLPFIPTNTNQLTNGANFITAAQAPVQSVNGYTGTVVLAKADVGLSNVDNTSDINKPTSTAQQSSIDVKMAQHNAAGDPHPQYTTTAEAAAAAPIQSIVSGRGITASTLSGVTTVGSTQFPLVFNGSGAAASPKIWYGTATSDVNGLFTVNISTAGFTLAPVVTVSAQLSAAALIDRAWATLSIAPTTTSVSGYTLRGNPITGSGDSVRLAPNVTVNIMAIGI
ncbi:minor tail protein [Pseudomonas phage UNO-G1W1]|uniref:Minor tail protein n=1 Tax=Pseudomonas phage UNO-G1W1 TaxID=3136609 RepID=A0AAX4MVQ7_9CAUD